MSYIVFCRSLFWEDVGQSFIGTFRHKIGSFEIQGHLIEFFPMRIVPEMTDAEISIPSVFDLTEHVPLTIHKNP